jgi:hypothetical protein
MEDGSELGVGWQNTTLKLVDDIFLHPEWKQQTITWDGIMKRLQTTSHPGDLNNYFPQLSGTYMFRSPYAVAWRRLNPQQFVEVSEGWKVAKSIGQVRAAELAEKEAALTAEPAPFWGRPSQPYVERMRASFQWYERARNILQEIIEDPQYRGLVDPISKKNPFDC